MNHALPLQNTRVRGGAGTDALLRQKCACGAPTSSLTGRCGACRSPSAQGSLAPAGYAGSAPAQPAGIDAVLRASGQPLEATARGFFERRFGHDFSRVRVHTDPAAAASARAETARAYTVGERVVFDTGQYRPDSHSGRALLAHELAHVVQTAGHARAPGAIQRDAGPDSPSEREADRAAQQVMTGQPVALRPAPASPAVTRLQRTPKQAGGGAVSPWRGGNQCDRSSGRNRENIDFPNTRISRVTVDLSAANLTLQWHNPTGLTLPAGPYGISAGAGRCCVDCNDETVSQTAETLCTPKGSFFVNGKGCVLSNTSWAHNPTYFSRAGIAIHAGPLPAYPASHGCVRTEEEASEIVHDNAVYSAAYAADPASDQPERRTERRTEIVVQGTWDGSRCYRPGQRDAVLRSSACPARSGAAPGGGTSGGGTEPDAAPPAVARRDAEDGDGAGPA